ncbi:MAG TPA: DedA family protein [Candidatus Ozemobacteraceae bacterium]|nr:DedA family protein [Candidatus Ozemobacteraceae bacterium]
MDWFTQLEPLFSHWSYVAVFMVLVLCGVGLPVPEEITFITAGYVVSDIGADLRIMVIVSLIGLMIGDSLIYYFGKNYGQAILRHWPFHILFSEKMLAKSRRFFDKYGSRAVFFAGFFAGIRSTTYFLTGSMRFNYWKFLFWDFIRAVLTCPISIWAGYKFGPYADQWLGANARYMFAALLIIGILMILRSIIYAASEADSQKKG